MESSEYETRDDSERILSFFPRMSRLCDIGETVVPVTTW